MKTLSQVVTDIKKGILPLLSASIEELWKHQQEALDTIDSYLSSARDQACLICLPTGTGKTGIIAAVSHYGSYSGNCLIVTPRTSISDQCRIKVNRTGKHSFFYNKKSLESSRTILDDDIVDFYKIPKENKIIVTTIQKIEQMHRESELKNSGVDFKKFMNSIGLIVFDEGHWEPAAKWAGCLRSSVVKKTILFTATPIRNDYKEFNLSEEDLFIGISLQEAIENLFLKDVEFVEEHIDLDPKSFVDFIAQKSNIFRDVKINKILIRCENAEQVRSLGDQFNLAFKELKVLAVHENFVAENIGNVSYKKIVPHKSKKGETELKDYDVYIHQFKLIEGFDNPGIGTLFIYSPFDNVRMLVQQIGRVLRNEGKQPGQKAKVFSHISHSQKELWEQYRMYDRMSEEDKANALNLLSNPLKEALSNIPKLTYIQGRFRERFSKDNYTNESYYNSFLLPLSVNIRKIINKDIDLVFSQVKTSIEQLIINEDYEILFSSLDLDKKVTKEDVLWFTRKVTNSRYLKSNFELESKTDIVFLTKIKNHLYLYSSSNRIISILDESNDLSLIDSNFLAKLYSKESSKILTAYLKNAIASSSAYSSKKLWSANIGVVPAAMEDTIHSCSNLYGHSKELIVDVDFFKKISPKKIINKEKDIFVKRYVGFSSGVVTDDRDPKYDINVYKKWISYIDVMLRGTRKESDIFNRYSIPFPTPADKAVAFFVIDFDSHLNIFDKYDFLETDTAVYEEDIWERFTKLFGAENIEWDSSENKFIIKGKEFENIVLYSKENGKAYKNLARYVTDKQAVKVFFANHSLIYSSRNFTKPSLKLGVDFNESYDPVLKRIFKELNLSGVSSEKGEKLTDWSNSTWPPQSLFGVISRKIYSSYTHLKNEFKDIDILVCDDLQTEVGDFILSGEGFVKVIHGKAAPRKSTKGTKKYGASGIHEVISQAKKNIHFLNSTDPKQPKNYKNWETPWKITNKAGVVRSVSRVLLKPAPTITINDLMSKIMGRVRDPSVSKKIIIIASNILSRDLLVSKLKKPIPDIEAVHTYILLYSLVSLASSYGVEVAIYCD